MNGWEKNQTIYDVNWTARFSESKQPQIVPVNGKLLYCSVFYIVRNFTGLSKLSGNSGLSKNNYIDRRNGFDDSYSLWKSALANGDTKINQGKINEDIPVERKRDTIHLMPTSVNAAISQPKNQKK